MASGYRGFGNLILTLLLVGGAAFYFQSRNSGPALHRGSAVHLVSGAEPGNRTAEQHFSPFENLEQLDMDRLDAAQHTIDIAMYSFTDRYLAEELVKLARQGAQIRIYRDRQQFDEEQHNSETRNRQSTTELFRGEPNIQLRVKTSHDLMHLKAYVVDAKLLRDGSANWSPTGLKRQDNNAHFTADPAQVHAFEQDFEQMWNREDNERVQ